ncbi:MAG: TlpA family protein disulfide reductase [Anaerolineae bacterium]|nr:TlpA family protein disulfide reductase [Anaerolineae bacterium]
MTEQKNESFSPQPSSAAEPKWGGWGFALAMLFLLALLALVGLRLIDTQRGTVAPGEPAPNFVLTTFDGQEIGPADMIGKVVLVNIWASWCKPCEQEAKELQDAWEIYEARGDVLFLGVDYADTEAEALAYLEKFEITYPNGPDLGTRIYSAFRARGVPETFIIDQNGIITYVKIGPFVSLAEITEQLDKLLEPLP